MNKFILTLFVVLCFSSQFFASSSVKYFDYTDPLPGAEMIRKETSVILLPSVTVDPAQFSKLNTIEVKGSISGKHEYRISRVKDSRSLIIKPVIPFSEGEKVTVSFRNGLQLSGGRTSNPIEFSFTISSYEAPSDPLLGLVNELPEYMIQNMKNSLQPDESSDNPTALPEITVTHSNNPSPGFLLLSNIVFNVQIPNTPHLLILKNDGTPVFSRQMGGQIFNFDRQPNGNFTYFSRVRGKYYELDTNYVIVDSFYTGNGYLTDLHELRVLPNRHALLMSYDKQYVNMSLFITGGNPNALVTGLIIQEIDENKNVVFQWRSWDHFEILDATHENLLGTEIDYAHGNAIEVDSDGNLMISSRHMDEITKISRSTGSIIWRLGGKNNQFTFINDPVKFSYQHDIRRLANGNITLFDNGNYHSPQFSRAVEYRLDEMNKTIELIWQYRNVPDYYGYAMGSTQRLNNGNTLIGWGATNPTLTEVRPDGSKALELKFATGVFSYRAFKYEFGQGITPAGEPGTEIPGTYKLYQNYPNPFNPVTKIKYDVMSNVKGQMSNVRLSAFDVLGKEVEVLVDQQLSPGTYEVDFDGSSLPSGVYFYSIIIGDFTDSKKMILVK